MAVVFFIVGVTLFVFCAMKFICDDGYDDVQCKKLTQQEIERLDCLRWTLFDDIYEKAGYFVIKNEDQFKRYLLKNRCVCLLNEECLKVNISKYEKMNKDFTDSCNDYPKCLLTNRPISRYMKRLR